MAARKKIAAKKATRRKAAKKSAPPRSTRAETAAARVREICAALPETSEKEAWGAPTFRVKDKLFCHFRDNHHGDGRLAIWCKAPPGDQGLLVDADSERFFVPPYVGPSGWVGMRLDRGRTDWKLVRDVLTTAWRATAPKRVLAAYEADLDT